MNRKTTKRLRIAAIVLGAIVVVAVLIITVAGGALMPRHYRDPWEKDYYERFDDLRMQVVAHGILAANSHNMQPWRIELDEVDTTSFQLFTDGERLTPEVDPYARQITISEGTFLEYTVVAAQKLGYQCDIELFPRGEYDAEGTPASMAEKPVAKVRVQGPGAAPESGGAGTIASEPPASGAVSEQSTGMDLLYDCLFLPDTVRTAYEDTPLTEEQVARLTEWTPDPSVDIVLFQGAEDRKYLGELAIQGATVEGGISRINEESNALFRGTEYQKNKYRYGFSLEGQGSRGIGMWFSEGLLALFPSLAKSGDSNDRFIKQTIAQAEHTPAYVMILTSDNSRTSQVRAGMSYARVQLTAQSMGLAVQPLSQILEEYPEMEALRSQVHSKYAPNGETIQMLVRVGRSSQEVPHSMRRDAADLVVE
jgi:hypothetical protein